MVNVRLLEAAQYSNVAICLMERSASYKQRAASMMQGVGRIIQAALRRTGSTPSGGSEQSTHQ
jgi:hypothetical protein